jgi:fluoride ion exporter CrcB/FEX
MRVNWAAVVVSAVVYWVLGALWYGFLFAKPYVALEHLTDEQMKAVPQVWPYLVTFLLNLLIAFVLAQICIWRNANSPSRGAAAGILMWIGFVGPVTFTTYMYEMRPMELFAINQFYSLVGLFLMGLIIGGWRKKAA